jgi:CRISPR-associated protein Cmr6
MTTMARLNVNFLLERKQPHVGLALDRYLREWPDDSTEKGKQFANFIDCARGLPVSVFYEASYQRWRGIMLEQAAEGNAYLWCGKVDGRLFLGTGGVSPLEAAVTLHHTYGMPSLPGSALKGLARAYASEKLDGQNSWIEQGQIEVLFGREPSVIDGEWDGGDAGYVVFHDAWWIPESNKHPLTREIVTVHHPDYYNSKGKTAATDFDSPTPNVQVAIQGSFLFAVEGPAEWVAFAMKLLQAALQAWGAGAKTAAGYGYFVGDRKANEAIDAALLPPENLLQAESNRLRAEWEDKVKNIEKLAKSLGKDWNKTLPDIERRFPHVSQTQFGQILDQACGVKIRGWETEDKASNKHKAYKQLLKLLALAHGP